LLQCRTLTWGGIGCVCGVNDQSLPVDVEDPQLVDLARDLLIAVAHAVGKPAVEVVEAIFLTRDTRLAALASTCYYMSMLDRRLQVLIDQSLWARLEHEAERRSVSVSTLVREAIDDRYPGSTAERRAALGAVLRAPLMEVPSPGVLRREREAIRARRAL
jgi:ribbon-helix-helix CopG family protein